MLREYLKYIYDSTQQGSVLLDILRIHETQPKISFSLPTQTVMQHEVDSFSSWAAFKPIGLTTDR